MEIGGNGFSKPLTLVVLVLFMMISEVTSTRYFVGGNMGWTNLVKYTIWQEGLHFYRDDFLFFVYDRNHIDVLEVNKTGYDQCIETHPIHNWTTGLETQVVPLNVSKRYYFIGGKGFCFGGMKTSVFVEKYRPLPIYGSPCSFGTDRGHIGLQAVFAIAAVWANFLHFWLL